jgi:hypothetical protein
MDSQTHPDLRFLMIIEICGWYLPLLLTNAETTNICIITAWELIAEGIGDFIASLRFLGSMGLCFFAFRIVYTFDFSSFNASSCIASYYSYRYFY